MITIRTSNCIIRIKVGLRFCLVRVLLYHSADYVSHKLFHHQPILKNLSRPTNLALLLESMHYKRDRLHERRTIYELQKRLSRVQYVPIRRLKNRHLLTFEYEHKSNRELREIGVTERVNQLS